MIRSFILAVLSTIISLSSAWSFDFTVQGNAAYLDRLWNEYGWTGFQLPKAIRWADVKVRNAAGNGVLGTGTTDENGNFTVAATKSGSSVTFYVEITARTADDSVALVTTPAIEVRFKKGGALYSMKSANFAATPGAVVNVGPMLSPVLTTVENHMGNPFNIFDIAMDVMLFWIETSSADPKANKSVTLSWGELGIETFTKGKHVSLAADDGYDDGVIARGAFHLVTFVWSDSDSPNPGGIHLLGDGDQDPRLAFDEGNVTALATFLMGKQYGQPYYVDMQGKQFFDSVQVLFDPEQVKFSHGGGALSGPDGLWGESDESAVAGAIYDLLDDGTLAGGDDDGVSYLTQVNGAPLSHAYRAVFESFKSKSLSGSNSQQTQVAKFAYQWDKQHSQNGGDAQFDKVLSVLLPRRIQLVPDVNEPNNTKAQGTAITADCVWSEPQTLYSVQAGQLYTPGDNDEDHFVFDVSVAGTKYVFETRDAWADPLCLGGCVNSMADPEVVARGPDGKIIKADKDGAGKPHARIAFTATKTGLHEVVVSNQTNTKKLRGVGSYAYRLCPG